MANIILRKMTKQLARQYYRKFEMDPILFMDMALYKPYVYSEAQSDARFERHMSFGREYLAIILDENCIGEVIFKEIKPEESSCVFSICLQNDSVKNKGYGTQAELLALEYAFSKLDVKTVYADAVQKNQRSQHVLEKVGFMQTHQDELFKHYRCDRDTWKHQKG